MAGFLRIKIGNRVIDIHEFDMTFIPGQVRMDARQFKLHGDFDEVEPVGKPEPEEPKQAEPDRPVITQEQIINEFKPKENE